MLMPRKVAHRKHHRGRTDTGKTHCCDVDEVPAPHAIFDAGGNIGFTGHSTALAWVN